MLSSGVDVIIWDKMLSSGMKCYHLEIMLSSGTKCYHLGWDVIIWDVMLLSGTKCYHLGWDVIIWDAMLSYGANVIIWNKCFMWEEMLSSRSSVIILSKCYHLVLSCDVIIWDDNTPLFYFSWKLHSLAERPYSFCPSRTPALHLLY